MKKSSLLTILTLFLWESQMSQTPVDVAENTLKVAALSEEIFYYGFAEGDQLIFNFEEVNGKELKEIEIIEYPSSSKFMDYKTKKVENKTIQITRTGVYKFRLSNSAISGRICKCKIQRIPANESTKGFNSSVYWKTLYDTTYSTSKVKYLVKRDTLIENVLDQTARVHSNTALNGQPNKTIVDFILPENTVCWSYWIGVGNEGKQAFKNAEKKFFADAAFTAIKIPGYGVLAAIALGATSYFINPSLGDNIHYYFLSDYVAVQNFEAGNTFMQYKQGNVVSDCGKMSFHKVGKCYLGLLNDNFREGIDVSVKIVAIRVIEEWGIKDVQKADVSSRKEPYLKN